MGRRKGIKKEHLVIVFFVFAIVMISTLIVVMTKKEKQAAAYEATQHQAAVIKHQEENKKTYKTVALTFDDGPRKGTTDVLLDTLKRENVKGTFFVVGTQVENEPDLLQRIVTEGHVIGSHSYQHKNLAKMPPAELKKDSEKMEAIFQQTVQQSVRYVRPPYGATNKDVNKTLLLPSIQWSVDSKDWVSRDEKAIIKQIKENIFDGAIVLMHDIHPETVAAVPMVIKELRDEGYEFVTIDDMFQLSQVPMNYYSRFNIKRI